MRDDDLIHRPGKGWTPWDDRHPVAVDTVWWQAKELHFPKLNVTCWFNGSELVGIEHWGFRPKQWTMRKKPADWTPRPAGYLEAAEQAWLEWQATQGVLDLAA
jgi:hypothetical protein